MKFKVLGQYVVSLLIGIVLSYILLAIAHGPEIIESWIPLIAGLASLPLSILVFKWREQNDAYEEDEKG
ncbi:MULTISPECIES: hypothetical protein [Pontibacillus]|uniref:Uncharacterized protein n=1 Tax=Pontibacillus marinus BH030004 = DSM 16465 TaxID=1385511 RepID=A0A0A5FRF1_9BACI|nr:MULTISPECIES: hypothetical protein [Pontibacillus]KGX83361.1 hypothetical protein N783_04345 [Pontibacillus marinus BH030004 = DSM 16465]QHE50879.1 hypothetical protein GS400_01955 [Pontibacillus sp. HMF3514]QHE52759.1 hypothetical protein GS400_12285 [Pontibacillus sp. HMF3514]